MQLVLDPDMIPCVTGEAALTELYDIEALDRVYRSRLLRFVAYSTGDQDLAETIVQDCLLKAYNSRESFRGDCAFTPGWPISPPTWCATSSAAASFSSGERCTGQRPT